VLSFAIKVHPKYKFKYIDQFFGVCKKVVVRAGERFKDVLFYNIGLVVSHYNNDDTWKGVIYFRFVPNLARFI